MTVLIYVLQAMISQLGASSVTFGMLFELQKPQDVGVLVPCGLEKGNAYKAVALLSLTSSMS